MAERVIALDFDDVLIDFYGGFVPYHNTLHGSEVEYEKIFTYDMHIIYDCEPVTIANRVLGFYVSQEHVNTPAIAGAVEAIKRLRQKFTLDIVTSRAEAFRECTRSWIESILPCTFRQFHFTNGFGAAEDARKRAKSEVCKEIGALLLIEDALKHAADVASNGIPVLLPDRPWNRSYTPQGVIRVHSWDEAVSWINTNIQ